MKANFNQDCIAKQKATFKDINIFKTKFDDENIDHDVVDAFGKEWEKFYSFDDAEIEKVGDMYFDIVDEKIINKNTYAIDIGCGTGRWTKYLIDKIGFVEAIDPSDAIYVADKLIAEKQNVRFSKAITDKIPFDDETFDFGMSIGVLHHIPDTAKAMKNCVKKVKIGGHFYTYLYYNLENKGFVFKLIFNIVTAIRKVTCKLPESIKKIVCELIAFLVYLPIILLGRFFAKIGLHKIASKLPLSFYQNKSLFIIRNDALDRFGTSLEQRFSKQQVIEMMQNAGLSEIKVSENMPLYHAIGKRVK